MDPLGRDKRLRVPAHRSHHKQSNDADPTLRSLPSLDAKAFCLTPVCELSRLDRYSIEREDISPGRRQPRACYSALPNVS